MAYKNLAFKEIKTIDDFKADLLKYPEYVECLFFPKETLEVALRGLDKLDESTTKTFIQFIHHVDGKMAVAGANKGNRFHKIPLILASTIYFAYYKDVIADLDFDEIALLSNYSLNEQLPFYQTATDKWPKELLGSIKDLDGEYTSLSNVMVLADHKLETGSTIEEVITYMRKTPPDQIKAESGEFASKVLDQGGICF